MNTSYCHNADVLTDISPKLTVRVLFQTLTTLFSIYINDYNQQLYHRYINNSNKLAFPQIILIQKQENHNMMLKTNSVSSEFYSVVS